MLLVRKSAYSELTYLFLIIIFLFGKLQFKRIDHNFLLSVGRGNWIRGTGALSVSNLLGWHGIETSSTLVARKQKDKSAAWMGTQPFKLPGTTH